MVTAQASHLQRPSVFHRLADILWRLLLATLLLLAGYLITARVLMGSVAVWQDDLLAAVNARLPFTLQAASLEGKVQGFSPQIVMRDLSIRFDAPERAPIKLSNGSLRLNPLRSLLTLAPQISVLHLQGLDLQMARGADGRLRLVGFAVGTGLLRDWLRDFLARVDVLQLDSSEVSLRDAAGAVLSDAAVELDLRRSGSARTLETHLSIPGNRIRLHARGVGDPLAGSGWRGDVYLHLEGDHLERILAWVPEDNLPLSVSGGGSVEAWLSRSGGRSDIALRARGENLVIAESAGSWELPLQMLSMNASLAEIAGGWRLQANDLSVAHAGRRWHMPRARFQLLGDSLAARVAGMRVDGIEQLIAAAPATPAALAEALGEMRPRGFLSAAELTLDDVRAPGERWHFTARIDDAAVDSWRGVPGIDGLDALVQLAPGGGSVRLDGTELSLDFPTVYREPLSYRELYGDLRLAWDDDTVTVDSDLLTATGVEGTARAVFSLNVPLQEDVVGPAMSLLVGLRDSAPQYRAKYLPFTLPRGVTRWLRDSLDRGRIEEGGFIWRGSLRRRNFTHRTVQMFFDLQGVDIRFDKRWPALTGFSGPVLIDDRQVSIWGERGLLGGAALEFLSAEMDRTADGDTELAISARAAADAADGLTILRNSPLSRMTGGVLDDWRGSGPLHSRLHLRLPVSDPAPVTDIDLELAFAGVDLDIRPGRLPLRDLQGRVVYRGERGFVGSDMAGTLWGDPVHLRYPETGDRSADHSIALDGTVDSGALLEWLGRDPTILAGKTQVSGELEFTGNARPTLSLRSALQGLAVSLPAPWGKARDEERDFSLALRLGAEESDLDLSLDNSLKASLQIAAGDLVGGNLALESDWLQAVYSPSASPPVLVDWLDLPGMRSALSAGHDFSGETDTAFARDYTAGIYRLLMQSPATEVQILDLRRDGVAGGHLAFRFESDGRALYARNIHGDILGLRSDIAVDGGSELRWSAAGDGEFATALDIDLTFDDLAAVFRNLGYAPVLESRNGSAVGSLRWPGPPSVPDFEELQGTLQLQARDGRLLQSPGSGAAGALKVVTLLNLAELLQGLSLSSMFESGIPFQRASSEMVFNRGQLRIPSLTLDGSASAFQFSGTTNLAAIDGQLVVTLPVANNLPWVAALAAGLPVAAGVFVVSKVFEKQVERMSSGVYSVSGAVDAPRVRLKRIFDNTAKAPPRSVGNATGAAQDPAQEDDAGSRHQP